MKKRDTVLLLVVGCCVIMGVLLSMANSSHLGTFHENRRTVIDELNLDRHEPNNDVSDVLHETVAAKEAPNAKGSDKPPKTALARAATRKEALAEFAGQFGLRRSGWERVLTKPKIGAFQLLATLRWGSDGLTYCEMGRNARCIGDLDAARNYYWRGLQCNESLGPDRRTVMLAELAWLEEDAQIAGALLEESCKNDNQMASYNRMALYNAVVLSSKTGSAEHTRHYWERLLKVDPDSAEYLKRVLE